MSEGPSPEDDLDCALFLAHTLGKNHEYMSDEERGGFGAAYMYFIGRYEAVHGSGIGPALAERDALVQDANWEALAEECGLRLDAMKARVSEYAELVGKDGSPNDQSASKPPAETD